MNQVPQHLIDEATKLGIVEGAVISDPFSGKEWVVANYSQWSFRENGTIWNKECEGCLQFRGKWATVITPAPSKEEGLVVGDGCKCGPAMRVAIAEVAKELGMSVAGLPPEDGDLMGVYYCTGRFLVTVLPYSSYGEVLPNWITPEAFIAKMRITAALPKPEPPIWIGSDKVKFNTGSIKVGCTTIDNTTVRLIASKLIDQ